MSALVDEKFREWTAGLDVKNSRISVFEHIRDIPYSLAVPMTDLETAPEPDHCIRQGILRTEALPAGRNVPETGR
jgi:hypothetical protein